MLRITKKQHLLYKIIIYVVTVLIISITGYTDYLRWLNPLDLRPEINPKQHDGSQPFNADPAWESSIQPMPDEDGVRRYLDPWELHHHGKDSEKEVDTEIER